MTDRCLFIQHEIDCSMIDDYILLPCGCEFHEAWLRHRAMFKLTH